MVPESSPRPFARFSPSGFSPVSARQQPRNEREWQLQLNPGLTNHPHHTCPGLCLGVASWGVSPGRAHFTSPHPQAEFVARKSSSRVSLFCPLLRESLSPIRMPSAGIHLSPYPPPSSTSDTPVTRGRDTTIHSFRSGARRLAHAGRQWLNCEASVSLTQSRRCRIRANRAIRSLRGTATGRGHLDTIRTLPLFRRV